ncbi:MAG TPA: DUF1761 domain-containing protein [Caulobacteraceae bacterium]|jgi:hypothetical protein
MLKGLNWTAVLVSAVLLEALGYLWYGPLFGKLWTAAMGPAAANGHQTLAMALGVVNTLILVIGLAWLLRRLGASALTAAVAGALAAWFFFDFTTMAVDYLYESRSLTVVGINMGYQLVAYLLAGVILGVLKPKPAL